jgi:hypothetical protein
MLKLLSGRYFQFSTKQSGEGIIFIERPLTPTHQQIVKFYPIFSVFSYYTGNFIKLFFVYLYHSNLTLLIILVIMNKALIVTMIIFLSVCISISCSKDNGGGGTTTVDCSTITNKAFAADVNPIIQGTCSGPGCHGAGSANGPGPLTNYPVCRFIRQNAQVRFSQQRTKKLHHLLD